MSKVTVCDICGRKQQAAKQFMELKKPPNVMNYAQGFTTIDLCGTCFEDVCHIALEKVLEKRQMEIKDFFGESEE